MLPVPESAMTRPPLSRNHNADRWSCVLRPAGSVRYSTGGSIDGQIRAAEKNLVRATVKTLVIPGHGPVSGKPDLRMFRDVLVEVHDKGARYDEEWGQGFVSSTLFVGLVYQGV